VLPLEREGRALRVVLVVGTRLARSRGDPGELPVQGRGPSAGTRTLRQQQFAGSRHLPDFRHAADEFTRLDFLDSYDARFVIVTQGPIDEALAYKRRVGNKMTWYSTANSPFGSDVGAPPGGGFAVNVFLRDGDTVYRTWHTNGRGTEQLTHTFALIDLLPYGRQEEWQDSPEGWPQAPTYSGWGGSQRVAALYGPDA
jgi:hypothetical protein